MLAAIGLAVLALGQTEPPNPAILNPLHYLVHRAAKPIKIDGDISGAEWNGAQWTEDWVDLLGDKKPKPNLRTRAKMLWDDDYLYVAGEMEEPDVWATIRQHDDIVYYDNDFEVFLQPYWSQGQYYEIEMNAFNTVWDLMMTRPYNYGGEAVHNWDFRGLKTAVKVQGTLNNPSDKDVMTDLRVYGLWGTEVQIAGRKLDVVNGEVTCSIKLPARQTVTVAGKVLR